SVPAQQRRPGTGHHRAGRHPHHLAHPAAGRTAAAATAWDAAGTGAGSTTPRTGRRGTVTARAPAMPVAGAAAGTGWPEGSVTGGAAQAVPGVPRRLAGEGL